MADPRPITSPVLSEHLSTRSLQMAHNQLMRAVRHADERPGGGPHPLCAYVVLLLITGLRPEKYGRFTGITSTWTRDSGGVAFGPGHGDTKTPKLRRRPRTG